MSSPKDYISIHSLRRFDVCNLFLPELPSRNIATFGFPSTLWFRIPAKPTKATKMELAKGIVAFRRIDSYCSTTESARAIYLYRWYRKIAYFMVVFYCGF